MSFCGGAKECVVLFLGKSIPAIKCSCETLNSLFDEIPMLLYDLLHLFETSFVKIISISSVFS